MNWQVTPPRTDVVKSNSSRTGERESENGSSTSQGSSSRSLNAPKGLSMTVYSPNERMSFLPINIRKRKLLLNSQSDGSAPRRLRVCHQNDDSRLLDVLKFFQVNPFPPNQIDYTFATEPIFKSPDNGEINGFIKLKRSAQIPSLKDGRKSVHHPPRSPSTSLSNNSAASASGNTPIGLYAFGSHDDYLSRMNLWERGMWIFFWNNFCPGRSVLVESNPWYEFARFVDDAGVKCAIMSLVSIFVNDYKPDDALRCGAIRSYDAAAHSLSSLLAMGTELSDNLDRETAITLLIIFSIRDALLLEKPLDPANEPRWSRGFKLAQALLDETDCVSNRFWRNAVQPSSLRINQSILVGRATILPHMMMRLPETGKWDPRLEANRFQWLLDGREKEIHKIHGACGFSRRVLYAISQVTFLSTALKQHDTNVVFSLTAEYLRDQLNEVEQWCCDWNGDGTVWQSQPSPTMTWLRDRPIGSILATAVEVSHVTAETWRILGVMYAECRALRLPRGHPRILHYLDDLATCVKLLPTSGSLFTAQAPYLPVLFLGLLATLPEHRETSQHWFEKVLEMPVRSTIPPAYGVLRRLWERHAVALISPPLQTLPNQINHRYPWWEDLVEEVKREARGCGVFDVTMFW